MFTNEMKIDENLSRFDLTCALVICNSYCNIYIKLVDTNASNQVNKKFN